MAKETHTIQKKQGIKFTKASNLKKEHFQKLNLDDLWVIDPTQKPARLRVRLCGCRNVCLA